MRTTLPALLLAMLWVPAARPQVPAAPTRAAPACDTVQLERTCFRLSLELGARIRERDGRFVDRELEAEIADLRAQLAEVRGRLSACPCWRGDTPRPTPRYSAPSPYVEEYAAPRGYPQRDCPTCPLVPQPRTAQGGAVRYSICPPVR